MARNSDNSFRETLVPLTLFFGDCLVTLGALVATFWLRYHTRVGQIGINVTSARFSDYAPLLFLGLILLMAAFANLGLYDSRYVLRRYQTLNLIAKGAGFWLIAYLGVSLALKFDPPISRLFVILAFAGVTLALFSWRTLAHAVLSGPRFRGRLQRRVALLGWNASASTLLAEITRDAAHPFTLVGVISQPGDPAPEAAFHLGSVTELKTILTTKSIDLLIATRLDHRKADLRSVVEICEQTYVEWKVVPAAFEIFLNGLRLQTIGQIPVLGTEDLAIQRLFNRCAKRLVDVVGASIGLLVSLPLMAVLAVIIKKQSPGGPVFFRQIRVGGAHRTFSLYKLRSMNAGADKEDDKRQSTGRNDPRLLAIGRFMRRWNLDELPQFWNVLKGEMSLVGPRPERPFHVEQLSDTVRHYLPRHLVKPGMTGWAQVHGLRGDSSIELRIQHDIYYIENWSLWLDVQILLLTFVRWQNAY